MTIFFISFSDNLFSWIINSREVVLVYFVIFTSEKEKMARKIAKEQRVSVEARKSLRPYSNIHKVNLVLKVARAYLREYPVVVIVIFMFLFTIIIIMLWVIT